MKTIMSESSRDKVKSLMDVYVREHGYDAIAVLKEIEDSIIIKEQSKIEVDKEFSKVIEVLLDLALKKYGMGKLILVEDIIKDLVLIEEEHDAKTEIVEEGKTKEMD